MSHSHVIDRYEREREPVACQCGVEVNMYFGSPVVGRELIKSLKHVPDPSENYQRGQNPSMN